MVSESPSVVNVEGLHLSFGGVVDFQLVRPLGVQALGAAAMAAKRAEVRCMVTSTVAGTAITANPTIIAVHRLRFLVLRRWCFPGSFIGIFIASSCSQSDRLYWHPYDFLRRLL